MHRLREGLSWTEADDQVVVLDQQGWEYFVVSGAGAVLWRKLEHGAEEAELLQAVVDAYEIDDETAKRDIEAWLTQLSELGFLTEA